MSVYPPSKKIHLYILLIWGAISGFIEFFGLFLIGPFMLALQNKETIFADERYKSFLDFFNLRSADEAVSFLGLSLALVYIVKNLFHLFFLKYEFYILSLWRINMTDFLYKSYMRLPYEHFVRLNSSDMISNISVFSMNITNFFVHNFILLVNYIFVVIVLGIGFLIVEPRLGIILSLLTLLLIFGHNFCLKKATQKTSVVIKERTINQMASLQQSINGFKDVRMHQKENYFLARFKGENEKLALAQGRFFFLQNIPSVTNEMMIVILVIGAFLISQSFAVASEELLSKLALLGLLAFRLMPIVNRIVNSIISMNALHETVRSFIKEGKELSALNKNSYLNDRFRASKDQTPLQLHSHITFDKLSYRYPQQEQFSIDEVSLQVNRGSFIGITGPSGSGKTTFIGLMLGLLKPSSGEIYVDGTRIDEHNVINYQQTIGYVDQFVFLLNASIAENIAYGVPVDEIDRSRVIKVIEQAQLSHFLESQPNGIDTIVGENGTFLSGGQRQRISIARALYKEIDILVLDEASSTLDVETEKKFFDFLYSLKGKITVFMVAHRLSTIKECDQIVFLKDGKIQDYGNIEELSEKNEHFRSFLEYSTF